MQIWFFAFWTQFLGHRSLVYQVYSRDPRLGSLGRAAKVATGQTETMKNCHADPHWQQPVVLKVVPEQLGRNELDIATKFRRKTYKKNWISLRLVPDEGYEMLWAWKSWWKCESARPDLFLRIVACSEAALGVTRRAKNAANCEVKMSTFQSDHFRPTFQRLQWSSKLVAWNMLFKRRTWDELADLALEFQEAHVGRNTNDQRFRRWMKTAEIIRRLQFLDVFSIF